MADIQKPLITWANKPRKGEEGLHSDLFAASCFLVEDGHSDEVIFGFLRKAADQVQERYVPDREISSAINYARAKVLGGAVSERWPKIDHLYRSEIVRHHPVDVASLERSIEREPMKPSFYLEKLFLPNELVCVAAAINSFNTLTRDEVCHISDNYFLELVNPNPMSAKKGITLEGKESAHCEANTGPRVYLVTEFDVGTRPEQASIIKYLSSKMPLVMILYSGGKSLHAWFHVENKHEYYVKAFFEDARMLGADTVTWSKCQFCRLPGGRNQRTLKMQSVLYFNPPPRITTTP